MTWSLIAELGIEYPSPSQVKGQSRLAFPSFAAAAPDGTVLIGDELGVEKQVPFRFHCRTLRVDGTGQILYDSLRTGIHDGYGCLMDEGRMALLRRTQWELLVLSPGGEVVDRLELETFSKRMPRFATWTCRGTFLLVFYNRSRDLDVVEIDLRGRLLWSLPDVAPVGIVGSAQLLPADTILIADPFRHIVIEVDRDGRIVWQFGEGEDPSSRPSRLWGPGSARRLDDGRCLIADGRNHRVLCVDEGGESREIGSAALGLCDPSHAEALAGGHTLICDTGNARVVEIDEEGRTVWSYGTATARRRDLSYPRSVEVTASGRYLVADTAHDRIAEVTSRKVREQPFLGQPRLFWPRCVRTLPSGSLLVADARNRRILELAKDGRVSKVLEHGDVDGGAGLQDPHDVWLLPDGHLLVTDSPRDLVLILDWSGRIQRVIGESGTVELNDPHSAQQLEDGSFLISDTGHHRVLIVSPDGQRVRQIEALHSGTARFRLHGPRYAEGMRNGTLVIADTGNNRILAARVSDGCFLWEFSRVPGSPLPFLRQPRWAKPIHRDEVVVCDHFQHRIVHVRREN